MHVNFYVSFSIHDLIYKTLVGGRAHTQLTAIFHLCYFMLCDCICL